MKTAYSLYEKQF